MKSELHFAVNRSLRLNLQNKFFHRDIGIDLFKNAFYAVAEKEKIAAKEEKGEKNISNQLQAFVPTKK